MQSKSLKKVFFLTGLGFFALASLTRAADVKPEEIDALFAGWTGTTTPGCAVGVARNGEWVHRAGYGLANLEYGIALTTRSVFRLASLSKPFTALSVLLLAEEGKLSLDDEVRLYVPELPPREPPVLIRHLLEHTSGYREYLDLMPLIGKGDESNYSAAEAIDMLARQKEHNFAAGEQQLISDTGYMLLSVIVERASGKSLREYADEKIFRPLGMEDTFYNDDHTRIVRNRAKGYAPNPEGGFKTDETTADIVGDGGVFTTVEDLLLFDRNFAEPKVGSPQTLARMRDPRVTLPGGQVSRHGYGVLASEHRGVPEIGHSGVFVGFRTLWLSYPTAGLTVILLCNRSDANPFDRVYGIVDPYLADRLEPIQPYEASPAELAAAEGRYHETRLGWVLDVRAKDGRLVTSYPPTSIVRPFVATGPGRFVRVGSSTNVLEVAGEGLLHLTWTGNGNLSVYERIGKLELASAEEYAGTYFCEEIPLEMKLTADGGRLLWHKRGAEPVAYEYLVPDGFVGMDRSNIDFERDAEGQVRSLRLGAWRARNILCSRQP